MMNRHYIDGLMQDLLFKTSGAVKESLLRELNSGRITDFKFGYNSENNFSVSIKVPEYEESINVTFECRSD